MSLIFLFLKASHAFETAFDWPILLGLADLDLIAFVEWRRLWLYHQRTG